MPGHRNIGRRAASSRELQGHCQGKHQGEPDASGAGSRTCEEAELVSGLWSVCVGGLIGVKLWSRWFPPKMLGRRQHWVAVFDPQLCCQPAVGPVTCPCAGLLG